NSIPQTPAMGRPRPPSPRQHPAGNVGVAVAAHLRAGDRRPAGASYHTALQTGHPVSAAADGHVSRDARPARHPARLQPGVDALPPRAGVGTARRRAGHYVLRLALDLLKAMASATTRNVRVFRYDPTVGGDGEFLHFVLECPDESAMTMLDVLLRIQREQDPTIAFRFACRVSMCGSCGMVINGKERLDCKTNVSDIPAGQEITLRPMNH